MIWFTVVIVVALLTMFVSAALLGIGEFTELDDADYRRSGK